MKIARIAGGRGGTGVRWAFAVGITLLLMLVSFVLIALPSHGQSQDTAAARYEITFTGLFAADALATGVDVPSSANFRKMIGVMHTGSVPYWKAGESASAGFESLAEQGRVDDFEDEINETVDSGDALGFFETPERRMRADAEEQLEFTTTREFPLVTLAAKVNPSPDWFTGASALDLRPNGEWEREISVDLYAWDAGTEDGTEFDRENPATGPQGVIASLRNTGKFSDNPIAKVTFKLMEPPQVQDLEAEPRNGEIGVSWGNTNVATGYRVQWKTGSQGFEDAASTGREHVTADGDNAGYTIPDLANGTEYVIRVVATNQAGDGPASDEVHATPVDPSADDILVSNIHQNPALTSQNALNDHDFEYAQGFTTGNQSATIGGITLSNLRGVSADAEISVSILADSGGDPGSLLHTLVAPAALATGVDAEFSVPVGQTITLTANTSYFVRVEHVAGSLAMTGTKADTEDPQSDPGWSLADACQYKRAGTSGYSTCFFSKAVRVVIRGPSSVETPTLSVADASATEGSNVEFTVALSEPVADPVTVQYDTSDDTATEDANASDGADYTAASGQTLTFAAGEIAQTVSIPTGSDSVDEDDEPFHLTLSNPSDNAVIAGSGVATGTIVNNDETTLTDATLSALALTDGSNAAIALTPSFTRYSFVYSASVTYDIDSLTAVATMSSGGASVAFVGAADDSVAGQADYDLAVGDNLVKAMVTSEDGSRTKIYMVNVTRAASDDATLSVLSLADSNGAAVDLTPATFDPAVSDYTASVASDMESATVTATRNHAGASVLIITSGGTEAAESSAVDLSPGDNFIKVMVTAEDGITARIYTIYVTRAVDGSASDATLSSFTVVDDVGRQVLLYTSFDPETGLYDASVGNDVASVTATAAPAQAGATLLFFDGDATGPPGQVTRDLDVGYNRVKVVVTATDDVTSKIYIILVRRAAADATTDATLSALTLEDDQGVSVGLAPATFDPDTTDYTAEVANEVGSVVVEATTTDPNAVVLIFGEDGAHDMDSRTLSLNVGVNSIKVMVNAEDATTAKIYNLTVTRAASENADDATLSGFALENRSGATVSLTPVFDPATTVYTASVDNDVVSVTLTAAKNHSGATVSVIAQDGAVTTDTATVDLTVGENLIKAMVLAEDGEATMIYMVTVTRAASTDATLNSLTLLDDQGEEILLGPTFDPGTVQYEARVANTVQSVTARATVNHSGASLVFVGAASTGNAEEATQSLDVGDNLVKAMVTAQDGVTVRIYMVSVTRAAADSSSDATLSELVVAEGGGAFVELTPAFDPEVSNYVASVRSSLDQVTASATANHAGAWPLVFTGDGSNAPGQRAVDLEVGSNLIKVMVSAEDATTVQIYMVWVTRADPNSTDDATLCALTVDDAWGGAIDLTPAFDPATLEYTAVVSEDVAEVAILAGRNHGGASVNIIEGNGTTTAGDEATVSLGYGENVVEVEVIAEDGVTTMTYAITITRQWPWTATLTVGVNETTEPASSGFSAYTSHRGALSEQYVTLDSNRYKVLILMHVAGGLYLGTKTELPGDFILHVGDLEFRGSDSSVPVMRTRGAYWWALEDQGWTKDDQVAVGITVPEEPQSMSERPLASPVARFSQLPASHDGSKAIV
ncbi:MAG: cadherin-like beta sandwich domain-containing protein, partial [Chloroflexi bacterium]|nr:cadherin-like beta sandwich domain-containing protein [Chloroflexota bacterium]